MTTHGRDVSDYDSGVVWSDYDFLISKASESTNFASNGRKSREASVRAARKVFSQYHFAQPGNGAAQADWFLSVGGMPQKGDIPGWCDYEVDGLGIGFLNAFTDRYQARTGHVPGVYVDLSRYQGELQSGRGWRRPGQRLWIARYNAAGPGVACDIWQYQGGPDLNIAYTPLSQMIIGGVDPAPPLKEDSDMGMCVLPDGSTVGVVVGTDGYLYRTLDEGATFKRIAGDPAVKYLPGCDVSRQGTAGVWVSARWPNQNLHIVDVQDVVGAGASQDWHVGRAQDKFVATVAIETVGADDLRVLGVGTDQHVYSGSRVGGVWSPFVKRGGTAL